VRRRWVYINGEAIEVNADYTPVLPDAPLVMGDIAPYQSMVDGSMITSRSHHREHLRRHNLVEYGNDSSLTKPYSGIPDAKPEQRRELIRSQIANMRHEDFKRMQRNDLERIRWQSRDRPMTGDK